MIADDHKRSLKWPFVILHINIYKSIQDGIARVSRSEVKAKSGPERST